MPNKIYLWEKGKTPLYVPEYGQEEPYLVEYLLESNNTDTPCVIVIPGGAYSNVCVDHEGDKICRFLNEQGFSAFYLFYRTHPYQHPCMETDAKRAIRFVRYHAKQYHIDPNRIGIMGFSAGGHLTGMAALRFDYGLIDGDEIDKVSSRPDSAAPCYAVLSLNREITHMGTRENLLGKGASDELAFDFSAENIIPDDAPPIFMFHTAQDQAVPPECSIRFAQALMEKKIPVEFHLFPFGLHGIGLGTDTPHAHQWPYLYVNWLKEIYDQIKYGY